MNNQLTKNKFANLVIRNDQKIQNFQIISYTDITFAIMKMTEVNSEMTKKLCLNSDIGLEIFEQNIYSNLN